MRSTPDEEVDGAGDAATVTVDVLETAYDPDGAEPGTCRSPRCSRPRGVEAEINGRQGHRRPRGPQPLVVPFRVKDADGGSATASVFVPPVAGGAPYVIPGSMIEVEPGATGDLDLTDYVVEPVRRAGAVHLQEPDLAVAGGLSSSRGSRGAGLRAGADEEYVGPGAVAFEVTTGTSVDDPEGVEAVLSVPVQVGRPEPILRCPERAGADRAGPHPIDLDIASLCHVWTADPDGG